MPTSVPSILLQLSFFLAVDEWLHPMVVERIRFYQIYYVKLVCDALSSVGRSEEEPLTQLGGCSVIELQF